MSRTNSFGRFILFQAVASIQDDGDGILLFYAEPEISDNNDPSFVVQIVDEVGNY